MAALTAEPCFRVELGRSATQLELEDMVGAYIAERLTRRDFLSLAHAHRTQVAIDGDVGSMAHHDKHAALPTEDGTHLAIVDAAGYGSGTAQDVDAGYRFLLYLYLETG